MSKIGSWKSNIPKADLPQSGVSSFQSGRYIYFGPSIKGIELFNRIAKVSLVILGSLAIVPIPLIALTGGYGKSFKWIIEVHHKISIEGKATPPLVEVFKQFIPKGLWTAEIEQTIRSIPQEHVSTVYDYLWQCAKFKQKGLLNVPFKDELINAIAHLPKSRELKQLINFCTGLVHPFVQNERVLLQTGSRDEREFGWYHEFLETTPTVSQKEKEWAKEGFVRQFELIPLMRKISLQQTGKIYTLTITTRAIGNETESERTRDVIIDFTSLKTPPEKCREVMFAAFPRELVSPEEAKKLKEIEEKFYSDVTNALAYVNDRNIS